MTPEIQTLVTMAFGAAVMWVCVLLATYVRENRKATVKASPWYRRIALTINHRHTHDLSPETFGLLGETVDRAVADYYARQREALENVPAARVLTTPPEPEERIARDLTKARAVLRGAEQLRAEAKARGVDMPQNMAMEEAARMVATAFDDTY